jgi:hypothetical protein
MTTLTPKGPVDLVLAPVAVHIDGNLRRIRDMSPVGLVLRRGIEVHGEPSQEPVGTAIARA